MQQFGRLTQHNLNKKKIMAIVFNSFTQPQNIGQIVGVDLIGDPVLNVTEVVRFIKYGEYVVQAVGELGNTASHYDLQLVGKYILTSPVIIPAGTVAQVEKEGVSYSQLGYSAVRYLSFKEDDYRSILLSGNITFAAQHHSPAKSITVRVRNLSGTLSRSLSFPASWIFLGTQGRPSAIGPSKTGILSITSFATSDADIIAVWAVQS